MSSEEQTETQGKVTSNLAAPAKVTKAQLLHRKKVVELKHRLAEKERDVALKGAAISGTKRVMQQTLDRVTELIGDSKKVESCLWECGVRLDVLQHMKQDKLRDLLKTRASLRNLDQQDANDAKG